MQKGVQKREKSHRDNDGGKKDTVSGGGLQQKGMGEMIGGWDLRKRVRGSTRTGNEIDQMTLKEGPLVQDSRKKKVGR